MPRTAKISFIGLANWDANLFSEMSWPDPFNGDSPDLDRESFIYELMAQTAELEVMYTDPEFMKHMIGIWSRTRKPVWELLWSTTQYQYNPIENYNRIEDGLDKDTHTGTDTHGKTNAHTGENTDTHTGQNTEAHTGNDTETTAGTDTYSDTKTKSGTDTNTTTPLAEHYRAAYDSAASGDNDGLVKTERDEGETVNQTVYGTTDGSSGSTTFGHTVTTGHGETITQGFGDTVKHGFGETETESGSVTFNNTIDHKHDLNVHGNIGTVTTQKMIQEQREIVTFNFYDVMIRDFKERFCVLVY